MKNIPEGTSNTSVQRFAQGDIHETGDPLDVAISGQGFFILERSDKSHVYTRKGDFGVNKDGVLTNFLGRPVLGFSTNWEAAPQKSLSPLKISRAPLEPRGTRQVSLALNLDSAALPPCQPFLGGFVPGNPPASTTFNNSCSMEIYDSLGVAHVLILYFVKAPLERTWHVHIGIDGTDVLDQPGVSNNINHATLVFDSDGELILKDSKRPPLFYGNSPIESEDITTELHEAGSLPTLDIGDLRLNGVPIKVTTQTDSVSTTDASASFINIVNAINDDIARHKVTAARLETVLDLVGGNYTGKELYPGDFTINDVKILGVPETPDAEGLAYLINQADGSGVPGVLAVSNEGELQLVASDGRNIALQTNGDAMCGLNFENFDMQDGQPKHVVKRGQMALSISNNQAIVVGGNSPEDVGLSSGVQCGVYQDNSDVVQIKNWNPGTVPDCVDIHVDLFGSTQFSAPFAVTETAQDGYPVGKWIRVAPDYQGVLQCEYSNGYMIPAGQIAIATIPDNRWLKPAGDDAWQTNQKTGKAEIEVPDSGRCGVIISGALEDLRNVGYSPNPYASSTEVKQQPFFFPIEDSKPFEEPDAMFDPEKVADSVFQSLSFNAKETDSFPFFTAQTPNAKEESWDSPFFLNESKESGSPMLFSAGATFSAVPVEPTAVKASAVPETPAKHKRKRHRRRHKSARVAV